MPRVPRLLLRVAAYALLGAVAGIAVALMLVVVGYAVLWLWVFGDDTWPAGAGTALVAVAYAAGLAVFIGAIWLGIQSRPR